MDLLEKSWQNTCENFCESYGSAVFESWLKPLKISSYENGVITVSAPTRFIKNWVQGHYIDYIERSLKKDINDIINVEILVDSKPVSQNLLKKSLDSVHEKASNNNNISEAEDKINLQNISRKYGFSSSLKFSNYVVGNSNEFAYKISKKFVFDEELENSFNPLVITGGVGLGKTHLLSAIANESLLQNNNLKVVYLTAERFMFKFIKALNENNILDFKQEVRSAELLLIDDLQFMCGKKSVQEEFLHAINYLFSSQCKIVVACDRSISKLTDMDERIKSRLNSGISAEICKPDLKFKKNLIISKLKQRDFSLEEEVVDLIAENINSNIRELEGAVNKVIVKSQMLGLTVDIKTAESWLSDFFRENERIISIDTIKKVVAEKFNIKISEIESSSRRRDFARPRQIAMYLSKKMTTRSFPEIGRKFGKRDHSTVMHAVKAIETLSLKDKELNRYIEDISSLLEG